MLSSASLMATFLRTRPVPMWSVLDAHRRQPDDVGEVHAARAERHLHPRSPVPEHQAAPFARLDHRLTPSPWTAAIEEFKRLIRHVRLPRLADIDCAIRSPANACPKSTPHPAAGHP